MGFMKTGDAQPIKCIYNEDGTVAVCPVCQSKQTVVSFDSDGKVIVACECSIINDEDAE